MLGLIGVTATDTNVADVTVNVVPPPEPPTVTETVALPGPLPCTRPAPVIGACTESDVVQVAVDVISRAVLSE